jgi:hypothetical protein
MVRSTAICTGADRVKPLSLHEPVLLRVTDPRSGPRLCEAQRFMVPMRAQKATERSPRHGAELAPNAHDAALASATGCLHAETP